MDLNFFLDRAEDLNCSLHGDRKLEFYDKELNKAVCALCIIFDECRGHAVVPLNDSVSYIKQLLTLLYPVNEMFQAKTLKEN